MNEIAERARLAKQAGIHLSATETETRNAALSAIAKAIDVNRDKIAVANQNDLARGEKEALAVPLLKRLRFDDAKIDGAIDGIHELIALPDPIGVTQMATELDRGLDLYRVTCPIGVIGIIFESRPDAFVQISTLCLKSGNAVLLKGGREALETNQALYDIIVAATDVVDIPHDWIQNLKTREDVNDMLSQNGNIDLIIPRGSNAFVQYIMDHTNIPVMGHSEGLCHVYVDNEADIDEAVAITLDSKAQAVAVCNAAETLLVHQDIAPAFLPKLKIAMDSVHVKLVGDSAVQHIIQADAATDDDWCTEYLDYVLSVKIVASLDEAINHINRYGSGHTDCIVTTDKAHAQKFTTLVDSAGVYVNASTRFADGYRYGFGAEVGISTGKLHARGPVGLEGLVSYKYKLIGHGQIVADYISGAKTFTHHPLDHDCPL